MNENEKSEKEIRDGEHSRRDAETQTVLGIFITVMSIPVLVGTLFAQRSHAMVVNVVAGLALLAVGVIMMVAGIRGTKKLSK
ncbi:MAG: hypothetical protein H6752_16975 [Candidatus Omnitrophica bacterium]|nr:hypothetical protein [Candidatus Omnitrophota bacterium]MCA9437466.1 hypothetical protein [Candidatus Omnitrophota bacterium]MCB9769893.1 hypothetical protein [Candidatus Omnitrophota bacterium]